MWLGCSVLYGPMHPLVGTTITFPNGRTGLISSVDTEAGTVRIRPHGHPVPRVRTHTATGQHGAGGAKAVDIKFWFGNEKEAPEGAPSSDG